MIDANVLKVKNRVTQACIEADCNPADITIVAVSKGRTAQEIEQVTAAGLTDIGENKVQEALSKHEEIKSAHIKWHMVGHLQTNKVRDAVRIFDLIHSVDSLHLAEEINKQSEKINKVQNILLEIKTSLEVTKFGLRPEEAFDIVKELSGFGNIKVLGLMTIAPAVDNPEDARSYFKQLKQLRDELNKSNMQNPGFDVLSMGMTDDFEIAVQEGANMLRIGRAIFEG